MATEPNDDYDSMTRKQLRALLWVRRIKGWSLRTTRRRLIGHLRRADRESRSGPCPKCDGNGLLFGTGEHGIPYYRGVCPDYHGNKK